MFRLITVVALVLSGCASYAVPIDRMARAEAAARNARETGASTLPRGQLHLRLADEAIAEARALISDGHNERADYVLIRAQSDAELALAEAREAEARTEVQNTLDKILFLRGYNAPVTTTGATLQEKTP
jgi:hypothetical protein